MARSGGHLSRASRNYACIWGERGITAAFWRRLWPSIMVCRVAMQIGFVLHRRAAFNSFRTNRGVVSVVWKRQLITDAVRRFRYAPGPHPRQQVTNARRTHFSLPQPKCWVRLAAPWRQHGLRTVKEAQRRFDTVWRKRVCLDVSNTNNARLAGRSWGEIETENVII
jgi:hypothetical protein